MDLGGVYPRIASFHCRAAFLPEKLSQACHSSYGVGCRMDARFHLVHVSRGHLEAFGSRWITDRKIFIRDLSRAYIRVVHLFRSVQEFSCDQRIAGHHHYGGIGCICLPPCRKTFHHRRQANCCAHRPESNASFG